MRKNSHAQSHFAHCAKTKRCVRNPSVACHFFLNPPNPSFFISSFHTHQTLCESFILLCHLATLPFSIRFWVPRASPFKEMHSARLQSTDPRLVFHFHHGANLRSPSHSFNETYHEVESLLNSGTYRFPISSRGGPTNFTFRRWRGHWTFLTCSLAQVQDEETTYYSRGDYFIPRELSTAPSGQEGQDFRSGWVV